MRIPLTIAIAVLLAVPACNRSEPSRVRAESEQRATKEMERQRDDYVRSIEGELAELDQKIDGLDARASKMKGTVKDSLEDAAKNLRDQRKTVTKKLDDLKAVSADSWTTMKGAVDSAVAELDRSYENVSSQFEHNADTTPNPQRKSTY